MEEHLERAQKTITVYEGFSQATGMDLTQIRSPKPLKTDNPQKEILSRVVDSLQKFGDEYPSFWEKIFPSKDLGHTRTLIALQLELLSDKMVEPLLGQKTAQLLPIQSIARIGAIATGTIGLATQVLPMPSVLKRGVEPISPSISLEELPDIPAFQALQKEVTKPFKPKEWEKSISHGIIECTLGNLDSTDKMGAARIIETLDKDLEKIGDKGKIIADWAEKTAKKIVGEKITDAFQEEIGMVKEFLTGNSKGDWDNKKKLLLAAVTPAAFLAPAILAVPSPFLMLGIIAQTLFARAKEWRDREIETLSERTQKMREVYGENFHPLKTPWITQIFQAAQEEGGDTSFPKPKNNGEPTTKIVIVGETHEQSSNPQAYKDILQELAKKGFRQISMEQPAEDQKTLEEAFQDISKEEDLSNYSQILQCYCLARRAGMEVHFIDSPTKEINKNQEKFGEQIDAIVTSQGEKTDTSRLSTALGGPTAIKKIIEAIDHLLGKPREEVMTKNLLSLIKKGPIAHFGGAAHNAPLQDRIAEATKMRPLSIILEKENPSHLPTPKAKNSFSIKPSEIKETISMAIHSPAQKKEADPEMAMA